MSIFGGVILSLFSFQLGLLAIIQAKIYQSFPHYQVKHRIDGPLRHFISVARHHDQLHYPLQSIKDTDKLCAWETACSDAASDKSPPSPLCASAV